MKQLVYIFLLSLPGISSFSQTTVYDAQAEKRTVSPFHAIRVSHGIDLLMKQGDTEAVAISADTKEQRDAVKTEVVNGELRIYIAQNLEKWWKQLMSRGVQVKAYVSFKNLDKFDGSSGSRTIVDGSLTANDLTVDLSSGGSLKAEVKAAKLAIELSSGAKSTVRGNVQHLDVETSSGAHFSGYDLVAENATADASSGGKIELLVNKEITASASSGGGINYRGEGSVRDVST